MIDQYDSNDPFKSLDALEEIFASADAGGGNNAFGEVPDGTYQVRVDKAEFSISKSGNPMVSWQLRILNGKYANACIFKRNMLITPDNVVWFKKDLVATGMDVRGMKLRDMNERLPNLIGVCLEVNQKTKGDFSNVYIQKVIDVDFDTGSEWNREPGSDDDKDEVVF